MSNFFGSKTIRRLTGLSVGMQAIRRSGVKELQYLDPAKQIAETDKHLGLTPPESPDPVGIAPPEQIDADAYTQRSRTRRRAHAASSTIRTSPLGAAYTGAAKTLTGQ